MDAPTGSGAAETQAKLKLPKPKRRFTKPSGKESSGIVVQSATTVGKSASSQSAPAGQPDEDLSGSMRTEAGLNTEEIASDMPLPDTHVEDIPTVTSVVQSTSAMRAPHVSAAPSSSSQSLKILDNIFVQGAAFREALSADSKEMERLIEEKKKNHGMIDKLSTWNAGLIAKLKDADEEIEQLKTQLALEKKNHQTALEEKSALKDSLDSAQKLLTEKEAAVAELEKTRQDALGACCLEDECASSD